MWRIASSRSASGCSSWVAGPCWPACFSRPSGSGPIQTRARSARASWRSSRSGLPPCAWVSGSRSCGGNRAERRGAPADAFALRARIPSAPPVPRRGGAAALGGRRRIAPRGWDCSGGIWPCRRGGIMKRLLVRTLDQWREWLGEHHASESEVWLIFHKQHTGVTSVDRKDALDEALCFGWVDSLIKRLDDRRYAVKFTPRRADSRWSAVNRKRYAELEAAGRLKPPGIERPPTDRGSAPRPPRRSLPAKLPGYIQAALKKHPKALRHFEAL